MKKINFCNGFIYLYIILPVIIFLVGWTKFYFGIPCAITLFACWYRMSIEESIIKFPKGDERSKEKIIAAFLLILLWVYLSGIGKFVFQNSDHNCRNPIFEILVNYSWPVTKDIITDAGVMHKGLIYYIGFWMPAAVVGKVFGMTAGYCFQALWAACGIFIFYSLVTSVLKEVKIWPLIIFVFFSGLDVLGYFLVNGTFENMHSWAEIPWMPDYEFTGIMAHLEWWSSDFQFSSMTTQLFWVFNQALPAWIILMLLYVQKKNRFIVLILSCALLSSTIPFVGLLPFVFYFIFSRKYDGCRAGDYWSRWFRDTFTFENILGGGIVGISCFIYLKGNEVGQKIEASSSIYNKGYLFIYILFILVEVGVYYIAIYEYKKKDPLFYVSFGWLCVCPLIRVGNGADFCMRASIPALVMLYVLVISTLKESWRDRNWLVFISLIILLLIGSVTPIHELVRTTAMTATAYHSNQQVYVNDETEEEIFENGNNFSGFIDESVFYKYLAR